MDYMPPLADMRFVLSDLLELDALTKLEPFGHADTETVMGLLEESGRFNREVIAPTNRVGDIESSVLGADGTVTVPTGFTEAYRQFVAAGWGGIQFDPEYGGGGLPWIVGLANQELTVSANMAFSLCPMLTQGAIEALSSHGSEEMKERYLAKMISGEWSGTMNLTEPHAGSDVGALTTKAVPNDDGTWSISGNKIFITWGEHEMADNIVHLVLARTPGAPPGTKGISLFLVPKYLVAADGSLGGRNDVRCVSLEHKLGIKASPTAVLAFGEDTGAIGELIGEENQGMRYMFTMMNNARLTVGLEGLALAERAYQHALAYAQERLQGRAPGAAPGTSSPIIEHPDVRRMLMTMKASIEAMRALLYLNARSIDYAKFGEDEATRAANEELTQILIPLSKAWCTDLGAELTSLAVQVFGGMGYVEETGVAQHFRDARIGPIYEGTNGIQAIDLVMRKLPMRSGAAVTDYLAAIAETADEAVRAGGSLAQMGERLSSAVAVTQGATDWLLSAEAPDRLAGATPYLRMLATVSGGWMMVKSALKATARVAEGAGDAEFYAAKNATAAFYTEQILPTAEGLAPAVMAGVGQLAAVPISQL